jgi:hypothetical protein
VRLTAWKIRAIGIAVTLERRQFVSGLTTFVSPESTIIP